MRRIERLLAAMTVAEKIGQLSMAPAVRAVTGPGGPLDLEQRVRAGAVGSVLNLWGRAEVEALQRLAVEHSRLGIPLLIGLDVIHGYRTIFPVPLAEAGLFDPDMWARTARAAAAEAAAEGVRLTFAPMLDVARDARWGRMVEGPGEDTWVACQFSAAKTRGFQGSDLGAASSVAATAKHLCGYGAVTAGREYASVDLSERTLYETHLPPFAAAVAAGAAAIMPAFIDIAGVPVTANAALLSGWLRQQQQFRGVVISDYHAIAELCTHGVAADLAEAAALALTAGIDIDMASEGYAQGLPAALERGLINASQLDASVLRVLRLKEKLGLFENPYPRGEPCSDNSPARQLARDVARRAIVLLTHRRAILPFSAQARHIALIGPLAQARSEMLGPWSAAGQPAEAVTILEGLRAALPDRRIDAVAGVEIDGADVRGVAAAIECSRAADLTLLCLGEGACMSGEGGSRARLGLPGAQGALAEGVLGLGKPVVALLTGGRPLTVPWLFERADAVLAGWFLGSEAGNTIADVLTGKFNPTGKLAVSWPREVGQVPIFYGERPTGRPAQEGERLTSTYLDLAPTPQFSFGHGLSYSSFALQELRCEPHTVHTTGCTEVTVSLRNDSAVAGEVTVFLFVHDPVSRIARPLLELKGAQRVALPAGGSGTVRWRLPVSALASLGADLAPVLEPGRFEICAGLSAEPDNLLRCSLEVAP